LNQVDLMVNPCVIPKLESPKLGLIITGNGIVMLTKVVS
jgi:hypothetical protein